MNNNKQEALNNYNRTYSNLMRKILSHQRKGYNIPSYLLNDNNEIQLPHTVTNKNVSNLSTKKIVGSTNRLNKISYDVHLSSRKQINHNRVVSAKTRAINSQLKNVTKKENNNSNNKQPKKEIANNTSSLSTTLEENEQIIENCKSLFEESLMGYISYYEASKHNNTYGITQASYILYDEATKECENIINAAINKIGIENVANNIKQNWEKIVSIVNIILDYKSKEGNFAKEIAEFTNAINGTSMSFDQQKAISDLQGESYVIGDEEGESYEDIG